MSIYPTVRPSLTLDFQKSKQLDPRISFSRSSSATYVEAGVIKYADEHQARFEDEGLLMERGGANYVEYSEDFSSVTAYWTNTGGNVAFTTGQESPDGKNTGTLFASGAGADVNKTDVFVTDSSKSNTHKFWSIFAKWQGSGGSTVTLAGSVNNGTTTSTYEITFDVENGTVSSAGGSANINQGAVTPFSNGWYRFFVNVENANVKKTSNTIGMSIQSSNSNIIFWGAQVEETNKSGSTSPSSYVPTNGSALARAPDVANIGSINMSWYNNFEGTFAVEWNNPYTNKHAQYFKLLTLYNSYNNTNVKFTNNYGSDGTINATNLPGVSDPNGKDVNDKLALAMKTNDYMLRVNDKFSTNSTAPLTPLPASGYLEFTSAENTGSNQGSAYITRLAFYPRRLTDLKLQTLTQ